MRSLSEALQGARGQRFAQFVHSRYPLILVDEFQDTNQDQDDMLYSKFGAIQNGMRAVV